MKNIHINVSGRNEEKFWLRRYEPDWDDKFFENSVI